MKTILFCVIRVICCALLDLCGACFFLLFYVFCFNGYNLELLCFAVVIIGLSLLCLVYMSCCFLMFMFIDCFSFSFLFECCICLIAFHDMFIV